MRKNKSHVVWFAAEDKPTNPSQLARNDAAMIAKKEELLEFHDQKTAGIPGITPAYIGLKGRTTEKLCQTKDVVILKHQQCTLVGWELHPADRRRDIQGPERFLTHLPRCLFLKVEGATWQIDAKLGPGVFPLFPVIRSWELNAETSAQIKRRGFTWVPDFASTAFMIQGATLKAIGRLWRRDGWRGQFRSHDSICYFISSAIRCRSAPPACVFSSIVSPRRISRTSGVTEVFAWPETWKATYRD